jgi:hypothetical protein
VPTANPPPTPSFIRAASSGSFNDRVLVINTSDLIPVVERRVAGEVKKLLEEYKDRTNCLVANGGCANAGGTTGCYPWADKSNGASDAPPLDTNAASNHGRVPVNTALPYQWGTQVCITTPATSPLPTVPQWFKDNVWREVIYYAVAVSLLPPDPCFPLTGIDCYATNTEWLNVGGVNMRLVVLTPGPLVTAPLTVPPAATPRSPVPLDNNTYWQYYFPPAPPSAASENADLDDTYQVPPATFSGNRIYTCPLPPNPC